MYSESEMINFNPQSISLCVTYNGVYSFTIFLQIDMYCIAGIIDSY